MLTKHNNVQVQLSQSNASLFFKFVKTKADKIICLAVINGKLIAFFFKISTSAYILFLIFYFTWLQLTIWCGHWISEIGFKKYPHLHKHSCRLSVKKLALQQHLLGMHIYHKGKLSWKTLAVLALSLPRDCCPSPKTPPDSDLLQPVVSMVWAQSYLISL